MARHVCGRLCAPLYEMDEEEKICLLLVEMDEEEKRRLLWLCSSTGALSI
jgi:hypothetical protein